MVILVILVILENDMKLTNRQQTFVKSLLDLCNESQEPVHYTVLAERLGVSRFTAYDMLRVLERKGYVKSEYRLSEESKTGRSERVFLPTHRAESLIAVVKEGVEEINWEDKKNQLLELYEKGEFDNLDFIQELLARVPPEGEDKIKYCIEVITILVLHVRKNEKLEILRKYFIEVIPINNLSNLTYLSLFGGFSLGVLTHDSDDDLDWLNELIMHVIKFQEIILGFDEKDSQKLVIGVKEHFDNLSTLFSEDEHFKSATQAIDRKLRRNKND